MSLGHVAGGHSVVPRPATADTVITGATVVTVDADGSVLPDSAVAVSGGRIAWIGPSEQARQIAAARVVPADGGLLMPGLVNGHTHLAMTLFRGLADDRGLQDFLAVIVPAEAALLTPEAVAAGAELAMAESIRAGITTALDMYWWFDTTRAVAERVGFRLLTGPALVGGPAADGLTFGDRMRWAESVLDSGDSPGWLLPHSTYLVEPDQLAAIGSLARRYRARVHLHVAENPAEVSEVQARHGGTPVDILERAGLLDANLTMAHGVVLTDREIARIAAAGSAVIHCPISNLKLASGFCRTQALTAAGVPLGLGTDGAASANDLDMFLAMRLAAVVDPAYLGDARMMSADTVLRAATLEGARALGIDGEVGSIEVGKRADLVLMDAYAPALTPCPDPVSALVYAASRADVHSVWIDGTCVLDERRLTTVDITTVIDRVRGIADGYRLGHDA